MKGSIRAILGLLVVMSAAGGIDNATDSQLPLVVLVAGIGLAIMYSGVKAINNG